MWHEAKKNIYRPAFQHAAEFSSQNETNTTVTSQGRSEEKQQENNSAQTSSDNMTMANKRIFILQIFSVTTDWKPTHHVFVLFSWRSFCLKKS